MKEAADVPHADAVIELVAGAMRWNGARSWCNIMSSFSSIYAEMDEKGICFTAACRYVAK